ncbi:PIN domain-containing protein [Anaerovoracaceae bacterium 42-11]
MRILLDTNVIIHRENKRVSNYSIGHLFRWIDRLKYDKVIHPYTIYEIQKYRDPETQEAIAIKLESYEVIKTIKEPDASFLAKIGQPEKYDNDYIDNCLLYEVFLKCVDGLITEDRRLRNKAVRLGLGDRVFSINAFISKATSENPGLVEYNALSVEKIYFGNVDVNDSFFDSFRDSYENFNDWFARKCDEEAYICRSDKKQILGFLYLKTEGLDEVYSDIEPIFRPKRRLKVGTFKVESTGFRLGERFIKVIFDNALKRSVDEIYVTLFTDRGELIALKELLLRWGFVCYGVKHNGVGDEEVLVKKLNTIVKDKSPKLNYPNILYKCNKYILPILPQYHTTLLPDSLLNSENRVDFLGYEPHRYALQKVYISWAPINGAKPGDLILFYRMGQSGENKKYKSVVSTVAIVDEIISDIQSERELLQICQNRSVFTVKELKDFWEKHRDNLKVLKFIFVKSLNKRLTLGYLWEKEVVLPPGGPRPFTLITDSQFDMILHDSETEIKYVE